MRQIKQEAFCLIESRNSKTKKMIPLIVVLIFAGSTFTEWRVCLKVAFIAIVFLSPLISLLPFSCVLFYLRLICLLFPPLLSLAHPSSPTVIGPPLDFLRRARKCQRHAAHLTLFSKENEARFRPPETFTIHVEAHPALNIIAVSCEILTVIGAVLERRPHQHTCGTVLLFWSIAPSGRKLLC